MSAFILGPALLFCPADRPERFEKAAARADAVILDLEDAVSADAKPAARRALLAAQLDPPRTVVRVNPVGSPELAADLDALARTDLRTIMLAKAESADALDALDPRFRVIAQCETARGVAEAERLAAHDRVIALAWGAEDLVASLGGTSSRGADGRYRDVVRHARSRILLAAGAAGTAAIDAVHVDLDDPAGLAEEAADAAASGFAATACIHPAQVEIVREAYRPAPELLAWAEAVLAAAEGERGVFRFDGKMIDEPVLAHARRIRRRSGA